MLVGRDAELLAFADAVDAGPGAPGRATLYTGVRGVGKTVMLNEVESAARERGWWSWPRRRFPAWSADWSGTGYPRWPSNWNWTARAMAGAG